MALFVNYWSLRAKRDLGLLAIGKVYYSGIKIISIYLTKN